MATRVSLLLASLVAVFGCTTHEQIRVSNTPDIVIQSLAVFVSEEGEFEVYSARMGDTGTGAVLFGFLGAAVESGMANSRDTELEGEIGGGVRDFSSAALLRSAIRETFDRESDIRIEMVDTPDPGVSFDAVGRFEIQEFGFTLTDQDGTALHPFILLHAHVVGRDGSVIWDDREKIIGRDSATASQLSQQEGLALQLIEGTIRTAGAKLAYGIIYQ